MTRVRKIGPAVVPPPRTRRRREGAARILRGTDGRPVRARRLAEPVSLRVRLLRLGAVLLLFAFFAVLWTRPVQHIEVRGIWLSSPEFVRSMLQDEVGRRWITTPTRAFEQQLARDPWIDAVQVVRAPGSRLLVKIREAEPVFRADFAGQPRLVDRNGVLLPPAGGLIVDALPRLDGLELEEGQFTEEAHRRLGLLLGALDATGWIWTDGLARVDLADPDAVLLQSRDGIEVVVRIDDARDQLSAAASVWHRVEPGAPARVDLRFENQIVLRH